MDPGNQASWLTLVGLNRVIFWEGSFGVGEIPAVGLVHAWCTLGRTRVLTRDAKSTKTMEI
ncbi:uncharacterized protein N7443_000297 [Penicillium atrosanguineum]|uniref:Uncharacterized protein n=1 Tax=Penicillium atrosanguineum TaxID=1132637 RepID=A0A9W9QDY9_9EURO|nr:uncharacterized protein N7443_000297 [Penicillium atrosanguineum]KAJ5148108.1 hypothetical protein N7526_001460 [Penicillium atrosanguineum]KAJ5313413.1 hypothetical protein N7443_000297 [Penicillium atrosanguineum]KAJ5330598.1 hypothetical protein N7476_000381 [Penicillium atrosanguineum]